jgi:DHA1 family inner membrane transport protein
VPVFLLAFGVGMVAGTWLAGEVADWSVFRSLLGSAAGMAVVLIGFTALAPAGWWLLPICFLVTALGSVLVVNLQLRLMDVAGEAQTIGAALNHASLNIANAAGAWLGGVVIAAGFGYRSTGVVGAALAVAGVAVLVVAATMQRRTPGTRVTRRPEGSSPDSPM